jgi:hypothetical protein
MTGNYRGINYKISRNDDGSFESTVLFADGVETASYSREDIAVAKAENLIDDSLDDIGPGNDLSFDDYYNDGLSE